MSTKDTRRERRRRTSDTLDAFPFFRDESDQKGERNTHDGESVFAHAYVSRPILLPRRNPFRRSKFVHAKERKNDEVYSSLLLSSSSNSSSLHIVLMNYAYICRLRECIARAVLSVSRSYSSRDAERQEFKFHFTTTKKKKVKRNERGALKESKKEHT